MTGGPQSHKLNTQPGCTAQQLLNRSHLSPFILAGSNKRSRPSVTDSPAPDFSQFAFNSTGGGSNDGASNSRPSSQPLLTSPQQLQHSVQHLPHPLEWQHQQHQQHQQLQQQQAVAPGYLPAGSMPMPVQLPYQQAQYPQQPPALSWRHPNPAGGFPPGPQPMQQQPPHLMMQAPLQQQQAPVMQNAWGTADMAQYHPMQQQQQQGTPPQSSSAQPVLRFARNA